MVGRLVKLIARRAGGWAKGAFQRVRRRFTRAGRNAEVKLCARLAIETIGNSDEPSHVVEGWSYVERVPAGLLYDHCPETHERLLDGATEMTLDCVDLDMLSPGLLEIFIDFIAGTSDDPDRIFGPLDPRAGGHNWQRVVRGVLALGSFVTATRMDEVHPAAPSLVARLLCSAFLGRQFALVTPVTLTQPQKADLARRVWDHARILSRAEMRCFWPQSSGIMECVNACFWPLCFDTMRVFNGNIPCFSDAAALSDKARPEYSTERGDIPAFADGDALKRTAGMLPRSLDRLSIDTKFCVDRFDPFVLFSVCRAVRRLHAREIELSPSRRGFVLTRANGVEFLAFRSLLGPFFDLNSELLAKRGGLARAVRDLRGNEAARDMAALAGKWAVEENEPLVRLRFPVNWREPGEPQSVRQAFENAVLGAALFPREDLWEEVGQMLEGIDRAGEAVAATVVGGSDILNPEDVALPWTAGDMDRFPSLEDMASAGPFLGGEAIAEVVNKRTGECRSVFVDSHRLFFPNAHDHPLTERETERLFPRDGRLKHLRIIISMKPTPRVRAVCARTILDVPRGMEDRSAREIELAGGMKKEERATVQTRWVETRDFVALVSEPVRHEDADEVEDNHWKPLQEIVIEEEEEGGKTENAEGPSPLTVGPQDGMPLVYCPTFEVNVTVVSGGDTAYDMGTIRCYTRPAWFFDDGECVKRTIHSMVIPDEGARPEPMGRPTGMSPHQYSRAGRCAFAVFDLALLRVGGGV